MNDITVGRVVVSRAGHDKGKAFVIVGREGDGVLLLSDGKTRLIAKPKRKKAMHVSVTPAASEELRIRIERNERLLDSDIRTALKALGYWNQQEEEGYIVETGRH